MPEIEVEENTFYDRQGRYKPSVEEAYLIWLKRRQMATTLSQKHTVVNIKTKGHTHMDTYEGARMVISLFASRKCRRKVASGYCWTNSSVRRQVQKASAKENTLSSAHNRAFLSPRICGTHEFGGTPPTIQHPRFSRYLHYTTLDLSL